jgi:mercuric ion binding protein
MKRLGLAIAILGMAASLLAATKSLTLDVKGWTCGSCVSATRIALKKLDGVTDVKTDHEKGEAIVTYDDAKVTPERMIEAVGRLGYKATLRSSTATANSPRAQSAAPPIAANGASLFSERVSFFEVPLECGASEGLGCGSAAKPILNELDANASIAEARINHPGTLLVVVWKNPNDRSDGGVEALFEKHNLAAAALKGKDREKALKEFRSEQWYGAADVDRLSEHEARVIAARIVNRAGSRLGLAPDRLAALTEDLALVFARHLTLRDEECDSRREVIEQELKTAASKYLNPQQLAELRKAGEQGITALPGEAR